MTHGTASTGIGDKVLLQLPAKGWACPNQDSSPWNPQQSARGRRVNPAKAPQELWKTLAQHCQCWNYLLLPLCLFGHCVDSHLKAQRPKTMQHQKLSIGVPASTSNCWDNFSLPSKPTAHNSCYQCQWWWGKLGDILASQYYAWYHTHGGLLWNSSLPLVHTPECLMLYSVTWSSAPSWVSG